MSTHNNNCDPCAPIPTLPAAPPPTCGASSTPADCEEYISSDCVISAGNFACTEVYDPATGPNVTVGLTLGTTSTLTDLMEQLTGQACTTSVPMIGAILQKIGRTGELRAIFCDLVCQCVNTNCPGGSGGGTTIENCDTAVQQIVFTNITTSGFSLTFYRIPAYNYTIRIYDTNTLPPVFYTRTIAAQGTSTVGANYTVASSTFPNATTLPSGHTFEVEITTTTVADGDCVSQTFTVITAQESGGGDPPPCQCTGTLNVLQGSTNNTPGLFSAIIKYNGGSTTAPISYNTWFIYTDPLGGIVKVSDNIPSEGTNTPYTISNIPAGTYSFRVTPVCDDDPLCIGGNFYGDIVVTAATPSCAAPDITGITIS